MTLPLTQLEILAEALRAQGRPSDQCLYALLGPIASDQYRNCVEEIHRAWVIEGPTLTGAAIALSLTAGASLVESFRAMQAIDPVWTGPSTGIVPVRSTAAVLFEVIGQARDELTLLSFSAYPVQDLIDALAVALKRGVRVRFVLESEKESDGRLSRNAADAFGPLQEKARFYIWPAKNRIHGALMHAKAALADNSVAFITSANLTEHGIDRNMELGVLVRGGTLPLRLGAHVQSLIDSGMLEQLEAWP